MKKLFFSNKKNANKINEENLNKKEPFFPYQNKTKKAYFAYSALFWFLGLLVLIFSIFVITNLSINGKFNLTKNLDDINFFFTPILNLILVIFSWALLLFAPKKAYKIPKHSSIMFYFSFWFLVFSVILNSQLQLAYMQKYLADSSIYHCINDVFAKIVIILSTFSLLGVQWFFWVMRRKFAFMATDYEIYQARENAKKAKKEAKLIKKENAKLAK